MSDGNLFIDSSTGSKRHVQMKKHDSWGCKNTLVLMLYISKSSLEIYEK